MSCPWASQEGARARSPASLRVALQDPTSGAVVSICPQLGGTGTKLALQAPSRGPSQPHPGLHRASSGASVSSSIMVFKADEAQITARESAGQGSTGSSPTSSALGLPRNQSGQCQPPWGSRPECGHRASPPLLCMSRAVGTTPGRLPPLLPSPRCPGPGLGRCRHSRWY